MKAAWFCNLELNHQFLALPLFSDKNLIDPQHYRCENSYIVHLRIWVDLELVGFLSYTGYYKYDCRNLVGGLIESPKS